MLRRGVREFCALLAWLGIAATANAADPTPRPAAPLDVRCPAASTWIPARDGRHALYELHIANYRPITLDLVAVEVRDGEGELLQRIDGDRLQADLIRPGRAETAETAERQRLAGGETAVLFIELILPAEHDVPQALLHSLILRPVVAADAEPRPDWLLEIAPISASAAVRHVLGPPLAGPGWLAANGLSNSANHRRTLLPINGEARIAQRYAIDFIKLGANGLVADRDPPANEDFSAYGSALLAVADGTVVAIHDGIPENTPFSESMAVPITLDTIAGNFVILDIGDAYVLYGHLQPGSLVVEPGQKVRRGEVLGRLGNSGNSDAPHLHLHLADKAAPLAAEGLPFVFERFDWRGNVGSLDSWLPSRQPFVAAAPDRRSGALPLESDVIDFPE